MSTGLTAAQLARQDAGMERLARKKKEADWETESNDSSGSSTALYQARLLNRFYPWFCLAVCTSGLYFFMVMDILRTRKSMHPNARGKISDMDTALYSLVVISALRHLSAQYVFARIGHFLLPVERWPAAVRDEQVARFGVVVFKFCYFCIISTVGYYILRDQEWMPVEMGGSGSVHLCYRSFPDIPIDGTVKIYFMVQCGYHLHSWCFQIRMYHRSDFFEMILHHSCAIFLIVFSYYSGQYRVGSLVLFVHDLADVVGYLMKAVVDTRLPNRLIFGIYIWLLATWVYTRLYVFPRIIIYSLFENIDVLGGHFSTYAFIVMLLILMYLHCYWFYLFLLMGARFIYTGKAEDIQDKLKSNNPVDLARLKKKM